MTTSQDRPDYGHRAAVDAEGNRIGKISKVYLDDQTGQPRWVLVETGLVVLAVSKDQVKDAPNIDPDAKISESEQDALRQYYSGYLGTAEGTSG